MASINASTSGAGGVITTADATGILNLQTAGTNAVTINASQNVGIGTTTPADKFVVAGSGNTVSITDNGSIEIQRASGDAFIDFKASTAVDYDTRIQSLGSGSSAALGFNTNSAERMRISSGGNVSIGTTSTGGRLTVHAVGQNGIELKTNDSADGIYGLYNTGGSSGTAVYVMPCRFGSTNTFAGGIYWSGSVMQYTGTSDIRLKENIIDAGSGLDKLANIKVRSFDWKESGIHVDFGVIAQELEEIAPEAVAKGKDNEDGSIDTPYAVDTSVLVPAMIKAIQEQQTIINDLKARIEVLEGASN